MNKRSVLHVLAGFAAVSFALSATGYLAFKEYKSANRAPVEPPEPIAVPADSNLVGPRLTQEPVLDEQGFPLHPNATQTFLFSSKSLTITEPVFTNEQLDVFLPSSKVRFVNPRVLIEPDPEDAPEVVN